MRLNSEDPRTRDYMENYKELSCLEQKTAGVTKHYGVKVPQEIRDRMQNLSRAMRQQREEAQRVYDEKRSKDHFG